MEPYRESTPVAPDFGPKLIADPAELGYVGNEWVVLDREKLHQLIKDGVSSGMWRFYWQALGLSLLILAVLWFLVAVTGGM